MDTINFKTPAPVTRFSEPVKYGIATLIGLYFGVGSFLGSVAIPEFALGGMYMIFGVYCLLLAFQNKLAKFFATIPYFVYWEVVIRSSSTHIPNLYAEYMMMACFGALFLTGSSKIKLHSYSFIFVWLYAIIELFDMTRSHDANVARVAVVNSFLLSIIALWASSNTVSVKNLNILLLNFKIASIFLSFYMLSIHLIGHVDYTTHSNNQSTNGLAPVQVSAYMGLGTSLLFLSLVNPFERKKMIFHLILFAISCVMMLLSFSRGGLYFLALIIMLYLLFNRQNLGSYFIMLMFLPLGFFVYYYVTQATGGLILDRYQQEGSSGRDRLVEAGIKIFQQDPLAGVGTGNFNYEIVERNLYFETSGAHNDFIRAIAEHGFLGIFTYWLFYIGVFIEIFKRKGVFRQYAIYFLALYCLILIHNGLKISLQHFLLVFIICLPAVAEKNAVKNKSGAAG